MIIGYVRNQKRPGKLAKKVAELCKEKGIDFIYFTPKSINRKTGKVKGKTLLSNTWNTVVADIPKVIDISPLCIKHRKQVAYLQEHCVLTDPVDNLLTKENIYELSEDHESLHSISVPTKRINSYKDVLDFIRDYHTVNIQSFYRKDFTKDYLIYYEDREIVVSIDGEISKYSLGDFEEWFKEATDKKPYIVQKFFESKTTSNIPLHSRVNVDKNEDSEWSVTKVFTHYTGDYDDIARLEGDKPQSYDEFLYEHYDRNIADDIIKQIDSYSIEFAKQVEVYRNHKLMTIGIDFGVTPEGILFIYDANNSPGTAHIEEEVATKAVGYYQHLLASQQ